jgi:hypothetical protein|tara:strand:+ start:166 stop:399 length:234 start_codon:yes stop_codon:yes gene_type:complete
MNFEVVTVDLLSFFLNFFSLIWVILLPILLIDYSVEYFINKFKSKNKQHSFRSPLDVVVKVNQDGPLLLSSRGSYKQ